MFSLSQQDVLDSRPHGLATRLWLVFVTVKALLLCKVTEFTSDQHYVDGACYAAHSLLYSGRAARGTIGQ